MTGPCTVYDFDETRRAWSVNERLSHGDSGWLSMDTAPRGRRILGLVDGEVRFIYWGKTSHIPIYGWNLGDQGVEDCELCEPTHWQPLPKAEAA